MLFTDTQQRFETINLSATPLIASTNAGGIQDVADTTVKWFKTAVRQLVPCVGDLRIDELRPEQLRDWQTAVSLRTSNGTANGYLKAIRVIYGRLLKRGLVAHNPAAYVPLLPEPPSSPQAMHPMTYETMRANLTAVRNIAIIDTLWATGCRIEELTTIEVPEIERWEDEGETRFAFRVLGKGNKYRHIYAGGSQARAIAQWVDERPLLLPKTTALFTTFHGRPLKLSSIHSVIRKAQKGLPKDTIKNAHGMRHAFALRKLGEGYDIAAVSEWLGHSDPAFTAKVYCTRREDELRTLFFR